ncbi:expressed unknown protein [Seminavis robusta]|uniref:Uncharacterized protein n=1 Tax=Seminavis robusta TaxID=568900 RepID=A0A9N8HQY5_9STRA|nr:expressed unknown protein [Seminavis robusta]|eukprot:Sro1253_g256321.1  (159) ;mRNA; f:5337-5813
MTSWLVIRKENDHPLEFFFQRKKVHSSRRQPSRIKIAWPKMYVTRIPFEEWFSPHSPLRLVSDSVNKEATALQQVTAASDSDISTHADQPQQWSYRQEKRGLMGFLLVLLFQRRFSNQDGNRITWLMIEGCRTSSRTEVQAGAGGRGDPPLGRLPNER